MAVKPIPDRYRAITPYLIVPDAAEQIEFLKRAFGAEEVERMADEAGAIRHAEVRIGDSMLMMGQSKAEWPPMPCMIYLYVEDTDSVYAAALAAGATSMMEPADQYYGDRNAGVKDRAGNLWWIATHKEDLSPDEMRRRHEAHAKAQSAG